MHFAPKAVPRSPSCSGCGFFPVVAPGMPKRRAAYRLSSEGACNMGTVKAVCTSTIKGIQKSDAASVELRPDWGIEDE